MKARRTSDKYLTTRERARRSERQLAAQVGGRVQPGSGALPVAGLKGDVVTKRFMFDDKITGRASFSISRKAWQKLRRDAFQAGNKEPVLRIVFEGGPVLFIVGETTFHNNWIS